MSIFEETTSTVNQNVPGVVSEMTADEAYELLSDQSAWEAFHDGSMDDDNYGRFSDAIQMATEALRCQTTEGLNTKLYHKMFASQKAFKEKIGRYPIGKLLENAYEYVKREDILASLEYNDLEREEAQALLALDDPLAAVFDWYENHPNNASGTDLDRAWSAIEDCATNLLQEKE